jgi:hypothetical protein
MRSPRTAWRGCGPPLDVIPGHQHRLEEVRDSRRSGSISTNRTRVFATRCCCSYRTSGIFDSFASPDGIHWKPAGLPGPSGDRTTMFYNPFRKVWVYSLRDHRSHESYLGRPSPVCRGPEFLFADAVDERRGGRVDRRGRSRSPAGRHRISARVVQPGLRGLRERDARDVLDVLRRSERSAETESHSGRVQP